MGNHNILHINSGIKFIDRIWYLFYSRYGWRWSAKTKCYLFGHNWLIRQAYKYDFTKNNQSEYYQKSCIRCFKEQEPFLKKDKGKIFKEIKCQSQNIRIKKESR